MSNQKECDICYLPIKKATASNKTSIKCPKCKYEACMDCYIIYMKQLAEEESCYPKCMKCSTVWEYSFTIANIPDKFRKEFAELRSKVLFSLVSSLLPTYSAQYFHLYKLSSYKYTKLTLSDLKEIYEILLNHPELIDNHHFVYGEKWAPNIMMYLKYTDIVEPLLNSKTRQLSRFLTTCYNFIAYNLKHHFNNALKNDKEFGYKIKSTNKKCIVNDCLGYLNTEWMCSICNTKMCNKCEIVANSDHKCKKEDLDNIRLIRKDCVACPKCATYINRSEGCPQMWCTYCNTAFNWNTGKIVDTKNFHNPHYMEYLKTKRETIPNYQVEQDNLCTDELIIVGEHSIAYKIREMLSELFDEEFRCYREKYNDMNSEDTIIYSMKYINKEITLDKFKKLIQMKDKKIKYMAEIIDINDVFQMKSIELFNHHIKNITERNNLIYDSNYNPREDITIHEEINLLTKNLFDLIDENNKYRTEISKIYKYNNNIIAFDIKEEYLSYNAPNIIEMKLCFSNNVKHKPIEYKRSYFGMLIDVNHTQFSLDTIKYRCEICLNHIKLHYIGGYSNYLLDESDMIINVISQFQIDNIIKEIENNGYPKIEIVHNDESMTIYNGHVCDHINDNKIPRCLFIEKLKNVYCEIID